MIDKVPQQCPVCGMQVETSEHQAVYLQMDFAFCSAQCEARFLAHPRLYIGSPGMRSPKSQGQTVYKRRRLRLNHPLVGEGEVLVQEWLGNLMGVRHIEVRGDSIEIIYDLLQVSLNEVEQALIELGAQLGGDWPERLHRAFIHECEEVEIDAREVTPYHHH